MYNSEAKIPEKDKHSLLSALWMAEIEMARDNFDGAVAQLVDFLEKRKNGNKRV